MKPDDELLSISGKRILVTGGAEFIGSNIAVALASENDVLILDNLSSGSQSNAPDDAMLIEDDISIDWSHASISAFESGLGFEPSVLFENGLKMIAQPLDPKVSISTNRSNQ